MSSSRDDRWRDLIPGLLCVAGVIGTVLGILVYARPGEVRGDKMRVYARTGLARGVIQGTTEVWLGGRRVGKVSDVAFVAAGGDSTSRIVLALDVLVEHADLIRRDSYAQVRTGGSLIGTQVVYVHPGTAAEPRVSEGDTLVTVPQGDTEGVTSQFAQASQEFPAIITNVRTLNAQLASVRGTAGAFLTDGFSSGPIGEFTRNASALTRRATGGASTVGLALGGMDATMARVGRVRASTDSLRRLLMSERTSLGRFRRDSTLGAEIADLRNEVSVVRGLLAESRGTAGRALHDKELFEQLGQVERELGEIMRDVKYRPQRYIVF